MHCMSSATPTIAADEPVEMVNIRLAAIGKRQQLAFPRCPKREPSPPSQQRDVYFSDTRKPVPCPVYQRAHLGAGKPHPRSRPDPGIRNDHRPVRTRPLYASRLQAS